MSNYTISNKIQIWLEQLPDELPVELPLIEQSQVIASLQEGQTFTILMRVPLHPLRIQSWYSNRLRIIGWLQWQPDEVLVDFHMFGTRTSGHGYDPNPLLTFRYHPQLLSLTLQTYPIDENTTFLKLKVFANNLFYSSHQEEWECNVINLLPVPQLVSPPDANIRKLHAGGSEKEWDSEAEVQTLLNGLDLLTHYDAQLVESGWTRQLSRVQERLLWSVWNLHDRNNQVWQLLLSFVADSNHPNHYATSLRLVNLDEFDHTLPPVKIDVSSSIEAIPEEVLWQFFSDDFFHDSSTKQLLIGQLPSMILNLPKFPEETEVLGSFIEENLQINLFLRVLLSSNQVCELLTQQMIDLNWQQWSSWNDFEGVGFTTSVLPRLIQATFFHPINRSQCVVIFNSVALNCTDVTLRWLPSSEQENNLSGENIRSIVQSELAQKPIPTLALAKQTEVIQRTTQMEEGVVSVVYIITSLSIEALADHYQTEMQQAGWQQQATSQLDNCHLSLWVFIDEQEQSWQGILNFLVRPERVAHYTGLLRIEPLN